MRINRIQSYRYSQNKTSFKKRLRGNPPEKASENFKANVRRLYMGIVPVFILALLLTRKALKLNAAKSKLRA